MPESDCTFVCCVESGALESMTLRLVESLRRFGGSFARCPVVAVSPRPGPQIGRSTSSRLAALGVEFVSLEVTDAYSWYHFLNKARALATVERQISTATVAFLDSDTLVVAEPSDLLLGPQVDFVAKPEEGSIETTGEGDDYEPLWIAFTSALDLELSALPWVELAVSRRRARYYVNSGVFAYRRASRLGSSHFETALRLLDARIACHRSGIHWIEQAALGLAVTQRGLTWRSLPAGYNFSLTAWGKGFRDLETPTGTCILHYHNSMQSTPWPAFLSWLHGHFPDAHAWLSKETPVQNPAPLHRRIESRFRGVMRGSQRRKFLASCRTV